MAAELGRLNSKFVLRRVPWWAAFVVAPFAFIASLDRWFAAVAEPDSRWQLRAIEFAESPADSIHDLRAQDWKPGLLPNFQLGDKVQRESVWYRAQLSIDQRQDGPWAVYLVGPAADYAVFINGQFVGQGGPTARPMPQHITALLFKFPGSALRPGENDVHVHAVGEHPRPVLQSVQVGPEAEVSASFRSAEFALYTLKQVAVAGFVAMALVMLLLARTRSREAIFGWYAVALCFMAIHVGVRLMSTYPFGDAEIWKLCVDIAYVGYVVCAVVFVNRFVNVTRPRFERWVLGWGLVGMSVLVLDSLLLNRSLPWFFHRMWVPLMLPACLYQTWLLVRKANHEPTVENCLLALITCVGVFAGILDGVIGAVALTSTVYIPYTMIPVLATYWIILLGRFVRASREAEDARVQLEQRVQEKTRELEMSLVRMKDLEREQALSAERERIMRDMHDGVGAQLVQALSIATRHAEMKSIEEPLRNCLQELRLIIDSIEPVEGDLASVLGTLRLRMSRSLTEAGVRLRWKVEDLPMLANLSPNKVLDVSRIVHEAIANALKHSRAKEITLSAKVVTRASKPHVLIEIADNGCGITTEGNGGRGLDNMRRRASNLNAELSIESGAEGTAVQLAMPVASKE